MQKKIFHFLLYGDLPSHSELVAVLYLRLYKTKKNVRLQKPGGPVCQGNLFQGLLFIFRSLYFDSGCGVLGLLMEDQAPLPVLRPYSTVILCSECYILFPLACPECSKRHRAVFWCVPKLRVFSGSSSH